ncbi:hypothetical protein GW17_00044847 [Ensete ventricosum]|nr:hypothetical protein GW17_00044847 [Ensete ventricosum]
MEKTQQSHCVLARSVYGSTALSSECAQINNVGHAADGPGHELGRSRVGDSHIKRRSHVGLPQAADHSRIKRQPSTTASHASDRIPMIDDTQNVAQTAVVHWRPRRPQPRASGRTGDGDGRRERN